MPKVFEVDGFRGFFYSNGETLANPFIFTSSRVRAAKFWVTPQVVLAQSWEMKVSDLNRAEKLVIEHRQQILDLWRSYFLTSTREYKH